MSSKADKKLNNIEKYISSMEKRTEKRNKIKKKKVDFPSLDKGLVYYVSKRRVKKITSFMKLMTRIGDGWFWTVICVSFFFIDFYAGLALSLASLIELLLQVIVKNLFIRQRPYIRDNQISIVIHPPDEFSFPSGHTAAAFTVAFVFYYVYPVLFIPFFILSLMIGLSRVYLGLHYPTDVLGGVLLGLISAHLGIRMMLLPFWAFFVQLI